MLKKMMFLCMALIAPVGLSSPAQAQSFSYYHGPHMRGAWGGYYGYHRYPAYGGYRYGYYRMHRPYWRQDGAAPYGYAYQPFGDGSTEHMTMPVTDLGLARSGESGERAPERGPHLRLVCAAQFC